MANEPYAIAIKWYQVLLFVLRAFYLRFELEEKTIILNACLPLIYVHLIKQSHWNL